MQSLWQHGESYYPYNPNLNSGLLLGSFDSCFIRVTKIIGTARGALGARAAPRRKKKIRRNSIRESCKFVSAPPRRERS